MLPLFNSLLAQIIVLALLSVLLAAPFLALWIGLSIRRDLRRIADCAEHTANRFDMVTHDQATGQMKQLEPMRARIANSAFGR